MVREPMAVSIRVSPGGGVQVRRQIAAGSVARLPDGAACGNQEGICVDGLSCEVSGVCVAREPPAEDAAVVDAGPPDTGIVDSGPDYVGELDAGGPPF